jgi:hypothetical protein
VSSILSIGVFALDLDVAILSAALSAKDVPDEHFLRVTRKLPVKVLYVASPVN